MLVQTVETLTATFTATLQQRTLQKLPKKSLWSKIKSLFKKKSNTEQHFTQISDDPVIKIIKSPELVDEFDDPPVYLNNPTNSIDSGLGIIPPAELIHKYNNMMSVRRSLDKKIDIGPEKAKENFSNFNRERNKVVQSEYEKMKTSKGY